MKKYLIALSLLFVNCIAQLYPFSNKIAQVFAKAHIASVFSLKRRIYIQPFLIEKNRVLLEKNSKGMDKRFAKNCFKK